MENDALKARAERLFKKLDVKMCGDKAWENNFFCGEPKRNSNCYNFSATKDVDPEEEGGRKKNG